MNVQEVRSKFPIFSNVSVNLAYLDSAASAQKPKAVIDRMMHYLEYEHANIHRGAYRLSSEATLAFENVRKNVADFIGAESDRSIVFTRGVTESINLIARSLENYFQEGDVILLSLLEHHSNIVPWQLLAQRKKLKIEFVSISDVGELDYDDYLSKLKQLKPKLVSITMLSNALGTVVNSELIVSAARESGALVVLDAAQSIGHSKINVKSLDADFLAFSGHKIYGPTGIGGLYVQEAAYSFMEPFMGGGDMIVTVSTEGSTWAEPPQKFEAGTPAIAEVMGLGAALDFMRLIGWDYLKNHEEELLLYAFERLSKIPDFEIYGPITKGREQSSIISFNITGIHPHDFATIADTHNVQIRAGHHCAMPLLKALNLDASARMSIGMYTTNEDIDQLVAAVESAKRILL